MTSVYRIEQGSTAGAPFVYMAVFPGQRDILEEVAHLVPHPFTLIAFEVDDWDRQLTPWPAPALRKGPDFAGEGASTLATLLDDVIPAAEASAPAPVRYLCGYSLSGLFALWSLTQTDAFAGAASISGSLWYRDLVRQLRKSLKAGAFPANASAYLSLGDREAHTKHAVMATVETATEQVAELLAASPLVARSVFQLNPGGHFDDVPQRIAAGITWLLEQS